MKSVRRGVVTGVMVLLGVGLLVPAAAAAPWGACGRGTDESKVVAQYAVNARMIFTFRCGGPRYSPTPTKGFRHILWKHREHFEEIAAGTEQNWRDVADLAMDVISRDPDVALPAQGGKECLSRVIFLRNLNTNQVVRQQIVRMLVITDSNEILTVYPSSQHCQPRDPDEDATG